MKEIFKNVNLLYIINSDSIMMRKSMHQNYEILDVFSFKSDGDTERNVNDKLQSLFGKTFPYGHCGNIESIINKKDVTVSIHIDAYKVLVDEKYQVLNSYTDDLVKNEDQIIWLSKNDIKNETRLREGDKKILERIFDEKSINIKITENQGERWIDAKTIAYEEK